VTLVMAACLTGDLTGFAGLASGAAAAAAAAPDFAGGMATLGPTFVLGIPLDSDAWRSNLGFSCTGSN
jgi:hypothetical protein